MDEIELKYRLNQSDERRVRESLSRTARFGSFDAVMVGQGDHRDTYLDRNGRLQRLGWSLRIREHADGARITLKVPTRRTGAALEREEIESTSVADVTEVFTEIVARLAEAKVTAEGAETPDILAHGLFGAVESLGLTALFTVRTDRTTWRLGEGERHVADLVLDTSRYTAGTTEELLDYQMEIELTDPAAENALNAIAGDQHGFEPTR